MRKEEIRWVFIIINPLTARVIGAPQMILQPVFFHFPSSPLSSGTCQTPGLSIPWCCLPTSSSVCLVFVPLLLRLARWFRPDLMNGKHDHTTAVCVSLRSTIVYYCPWEKVVSMNGCLGGLNNQAADASSCWSIYDVCCVEVIRSFWLRVSFAFHGY